MSDREQLAARLVEAAWSQMKAAPHRTWDYSELPQRARARVDLTVVAVLRELAEELPPAWAGLPENLAGLADYIEKDLEGSDG